MKKRMLLTLMIAAAAVGALGVVKVLQIQAAIAQAASFQMPPEAVTTIVARHAEWPSTLVAIGTVVAARGVTVSADLPGIVDAITFDSGRSVRAGEVLVRLDSRQERAQLAAAVAQRDLARLNLERTRDLVAQRIVAEAEHDRVRAEHEQAEARVGEIQATIARKQIRAPFPGILGIRQVNLGQYLNAGEAIVQLESLRPIHVDFSLPQQQVAGLHMGGEVQVTLEGAREPYLGRLSAIDAVVDPETRNVRVRATLDNPEGRLRPGMFVQAQLPVGETRRVVALPASAVSYAPYGDSVFVIGDMDGRDGQKYRGARQQFVKLGGARGDQVAVLEGVEPGQEVATSGVFKLRSGAAIQVNNATRPSNDPAPNPEDN